MTPVLIIDDHDIIRIGLSAVLEATGRFAVLGTSSTLSHGLERIAEMKPEIVLTDLSLPDSSGLETVEKVVRAQEGRKTLVISMYDESLYGQQVLGLGADGYLMKDRAHADVLNACDALMRGAYWVSQRLSVAMNRRRHGNGRVLPERSELLSARELEILALLRQGRTTKEIAARLGISVRTVDIHRSNMKRKLKLRTGAELIAFACAGVTQSG